MHPLPGTEELRRTLESIKGSISKFDAHMRADTERKREENERRLNAITLESTQLKEQLDIEAAAVVRHADVEFTQGVRPVVNAMGQQISDGYQSACRDIVTKASQLLKHCEELDGRLQALQNKKSECPLPSLLQKLRAELGQLRAEYTQFEIHQKTEESDWVERMRQITVTGEALMERGALSLQNRFAGIRMTYFGDADAEEAEPVRGNPAWELAQIASRINDGQRINDKVFETRVENALDRLESELIARSEEREQDDLNIETAVQRYMRALQKNLYDAHLLRQFIEVTGEEN